MDVNGLKSYVLELIEKSKSQNEIARKCGISTSTLSQWVNGKYNTKGNDMSIRIARELRYVSDRWKAVETVCSYQQVNTTFQLAKNLRLWKGISSCAGSGKTEALFDLYLKSSDDSVVYLQCARWSARQLLLSLRKATKGVAERHESNEEMKEVIVQFVYDREEKKPIFLIDEADKLNLSAFSELNDLYNRTKGYLGVILAGTETLENRIVEGASRKKKVAYMDELESRLGRDFIHLWGATEQNVYDVCTANGLTNTDRQSSIWNKLKKAEKLVPMGKNGREIKVLFTEDFRCMSQLIAEELFFQNMTGGITV